MSNYEINNIYEDSIKNNQNIYEKSRNKLNYKISDLFKESLEPNSNIINNIWRININHFQCNRFS